MASVWCLFGHVSESSPRRWRGFLGLLWEPFWATCPFHFTSISRLLSKALHDAGVAFGGLLFEHCSFHFSSAFPAAFKCSPRRWRGFLWSSLGAFLGDLFLTCRFCFWLRLRKLCTTLAWLFGSSLGAFLCDCSLPFRFDFLGCFQTLSTTLAWRFGVFFGSLVG